MRRALMLAALLVLALTGEAQAVQLVNPDGTPSQWQRVVRRFQVPTVRARLIVSQDTTVCSGGQACTPEGCVPTPLGGCPGGPGEPPGDTITIGPREGTPRYALAHELGHQFAARVLTEADKRAYERLATYTPETPWIACQADGTPAGCQSYDQSPQESFADTYADCALPDVDGIGIGINIGPGGDLRPLKRTCALIRRAARRRPAAAVTSRRRTHARSPSARSRTI